MAAARHGKPAAPCAIQQCTCLSSSSSSSKQLCVCGSTCGGVSLTACNPVLWLCFSRHVSVEQATDSASATSLLPNGLAEGEPQYEGTVVPIADAEAAGKGPNIPVLYW